MPFRWIEPWAPTLYPQPAGAGLHHGGFRRPHQTWFRSIRLRPWSAAWGVPLQPTEKRQHNLQPLGGEWKRLCARHPSAFRSLGVEPVCSVISCTSCSRIRLAGLTFLHSSAVNDCRQRHRYFWCLHEQRWSRRRDSNGCSLPQGLPHAGYPSIFDGFFHVFDYLVRLSSQLICLLESGLISGP